MEYFLSVFTASNLLMITLAAVAGLVLGALPGVGPTLAMALLLPLTFKMTPVGALSFLGTLFGATIAGGSISAILLNVPGTPGSGATALDGYPMSEQGRGKVALAIANTGSTIGGIASMIALATIAPLVARVTVLFGPIDYFLLATLGLSIISASSGKAVLKGFITACLGLMLTFFGTDLFTSYVRFGFGIRYLEDGLDYVPILIGIFGLSQAIKLTVEGGTVSKLGKCTGSTWEGVSLAFRHYKTLIRSALLGIGLGALPAVGITAANFIAYNEAVRNSKEPETFGKGNPEGVLAPEAANNAVEGGALIPAMALGIPGSSSAAMFLAGLMIQGLQPGFQLFQKSGHIVYTTIWGVIVGLVITFIIYLAFSPLFAKVTLLKNEVIVPALVLLTLTGAFAVNNTFGDVIVTVIFGFLGYAFEIRGFPKVPFVLGIVLGPIMEKNFMRSILMGGNNVVGLFTGSYLSIILLVLVIVAFVEPPLMQIVRNRRRAQAG